MRVLILCLALAGCGGTLTPFKVDAEFMKRCEVVPPLEGKTGAEVLQWASKSGPLITECTRIHNGLVTIIEAQK